MIVDITWKAVKCDNCGIILDHVGDFSDEEPQLFPNEAEVEKAFDEDDIRDDWTKIDGKHYCEQCWNFDYDTEYEGEHKKVVTKPSQRIG